MWNKIKQYLKSWMYSLGEYAKLEYGGGITIKAPESKKRVVRKKT
jgi:hypothetical protein